MIMNKFFFAIGLLSVGTALGQTRTTNSSSTTSSSSNYNNTNTNNANSQNATSGMNSSTNRPSSTSGVSSGTGSGSMNSGTYSTSGTSGSRMGTTGSGTGMSSGTYSTTGTPGSYNSTGSMGADQTPSGSGSMNTNSMSRDSMRTTPSGSGSYNTNSMGTGATGISTSTYSTQSQTTTTAQPIRTKGYKNFAYGIYAGLNTTRFRGESIDTQNPTGRLGYQAGFFVRGGGRFFGQIGAEYFASSSDYFRKGDGTNTIKDITDKINVQYIQIPVYIGYKLTESDRGISAIRVQAGVEYANRISSSSGQFNLSASEIKSGSFNALGQLGFDIGPFLIDLTYHHGLSNAVQINSFQGSSRRIYSASIGFKF